MMSEFMQQRCGLGITGDKNDVAIRLRNFILSYKVRGLTGNREIFEKLGMSTVSRNQSIRYSTPDGGPVHGIVMVREFK